MSAEAKVRYDFIRALIQKDFSPPASIVELGAAPGDQIATLAHCGFTATAVDLGIASDAWAAGEEGRMRRLFAESGVTYVEWNMEEFPYPLNDSAYDAVVMTEVYEHLRDYPARSLEETRRILRPGGRLYFTTPNAAFLMNRLRALGGQNLATPLDDWIGGLPHARHAREYTFAEIRRLLDYAGLRPISLMSRHFFRSQGGSAARVAKGALDALARVRPSLGPSIILIAERAPGLG